MERMEGRMKRRRADPVGCGSYRGGYYNQEGYADPTAGYALAGIPEVDAAAKTDRSRGKESVIILDIPPVSKLEHDLNVLKQEGWKTMNH